MRPGLRSRRRPSWGRRPWRVSVRKAVVESLNLIIEVSGKPKPEKAAKVETARSLWVPAVNNDGRFGRWGFLEISDPWDAKNTIQAWLDVHREPAAEE